jgi:hypothetical protein
LQWQLVWKKTIARGEFSDMLMKYGLNLRISSPMTDESIALLNEIGFEWSGKRITPYVGTSSTA